MSDLILDLCSGSGAWSEPFVKAGYDVQRIDLLAGQDVRLFHKPRRRPHGILAAPPCAMFSRMRMCRSEPTPEQFRSALSVVDACLRLIAVCEPRWWALENPQGYLSRWLGPPALRFDPWEYGDPWTKRTWIWGRFALPMLAPVRPLMPLIHRKAGRRGLAKHDDENAVTPRGFAEAFFAANP